MSVILRHMQYPLVIVYNDPEEAWDKYMKDIVLEDIAQNNYDRFTRITPDEMVIYLQGVTAKKPVESKE